MHHEETVNIGVDRQRVRLNEEPRRPVTIGNACALDWLLLRTWEDDGGGLPEVGAADVRRAA